MIKRRFLIIFILHIVTIGSKLIHETHFLVDFIPRQNCIPKIVAVTCFTKDELSNMTKALSKSFIAVTYLRHDNFADFLSFYKGKLTFLLDLRCQQHQYVLSQLSNLNYKFGHQYFNQSYDWIILKENKSDLNSDFYCGINSKVFLVDTKEHQYKINAIFKYSNYDIRFSKNDIGLWRAKNSFIYFNKLNIATNRSNLNGVNLRVMYPSIYKSSFGHGYNYMQMENKNLLFNIILFKILSTYVNATYVPIFFGEDPENKYGVNGPIFFVLKQGLVDIFGMPEVLVTEHLQDFRYLTPTSPNNVAFLFKAPALAYMKNIYSMPFHTTSWFCLWGVLAFATIVLYSMEIVYKRLLPDIEIHLSFFDIIMIQISALFQKSSNCELQSWSGRIATGFIYMTLMIVTVSYNASIVVYLQATAEDITDFKDLYDSRFEMGSENISFAVYQSLLVHHTEPAEEYVRQKIIDDYENPNHTFIMSTEEGINKVQTQFFAFYTFLGSAYDIIAKSFQEYEKCSLRSTPGFYGEKERYLMVAKNSSLMDLYRIGFRKLVESGIQNREVLKYYRYEPKCKNTAVSNFSGTGIVETQVVFLIFAVGALLSLLIFILEQLFYCYRNSFKYYEHFNRCMKHCGGTALQPYVE